VLAASHPQQLNTGSGCLDRDIENKMADCHCTVIKSRVKTLIKRRHIGHTSEPEVDIPWPFVDGILHRRVMYTFSRSAFAGQSGHPLRLQMALSHKLIYLRY